jgi:hypothetical protein
MCGAACFCPSKNHVRFAILLIVDSETLTSGAFDVPSYR